MSACCSTFDLYLNFLTENNISNFDELCNVLCFRPYKLKLIEPKGNDWKMFKLSMFSDLNAELITIFHKMVFNSNNDILKPLYIDEHCHRISSSDINTLFPLSMDNYKIYATKNMTLFKLFSHKKKWFIVLDDNYPLLTFIDEKVNLFHIFKECCKQYEFDFKTQLNNQYIYYFFIAHRKLNHLYHSYRHKMNIFKIYDRNTFFEVPVESQKTLLESFKPLNETVIPTKYQLERLIQYPNHVGTYLIKSDNKLYTISTTFFSNLAEINKQFYFKDIFERFIEIKKNNKIDVYMQYFVDERDMFKTLERNFNLLVEEIYQMYLDVYVLKNNAMETNIYDLLFEIHIFHLQHEISISKDDIESILLFVIDRCIMMNLLKSYM